MNQPLPMRLISIPILPKPGNNWSYNTIKCVYIWLNVNERDYSAGNGMFDGWKKGIQF